MLGVPWRHCGRDRTGVDCIGLVVYGLRKTGQEPKDVTNYARARAHYVLDQLMRESLEPTGCIVLLNIGKHPSHVGVVIGDDLIHADSNLGFVTMHGFDSKWRRRVRATFKPCLL